MASNVTNIVACTLFNGDYHFGVGALANSLYRNGYRGSVYVGYQPPLPPWAADGRQEEKNAIWQVCEGLSLRFVTWPAVRSLTLEKPRFLLHILDREASDSKAVLFFDADIVVKASWAFFENWVECGIALCLDASYPIVPAGHPWRQAWRMLVVDDGHRCRELDYYVNGGFVGVSRRHRGVVERWAELTDRITTAKVGRREDPLYGADQDILNAALMGGDEPMSIIGQEGMDFIAAGYVMSHAIDATKPWRRNFVRDALLLGHAPSMAEKEYWANVDEPIRMFSRRHIRRVRSAIKIAAGIGRFYGRA
jgi:hypothetical protein